MNSFKNNYLPYCMWFFPLAFFAFQFILRLWPGLLMQQIMEQFSIDALGFGMLAAVYYYGYASMQIPMALLLDKVGVRKIIALFVILCGLSMLVFIKTQNFYLAMLTRFLIGVGSSAGFLGVSKVVSEWFSYNSYAKMIGFSFTFGLMGAIYGGKPVSLLIHAHGWQSVGMILALFALGLGILIFCLLREPDVSHKNVAEKIQLNDIKTILKSYSLWILAFSNFLMVGSLEGFSDVWGVPYLMVSHGFAKTDAAFLVSLIYVGMIFGGPILAFLSKKIGNYITIFFCGIGMSILFLMIFFKVILTWSLLATFFFIIGILSCYQVIVFAAGSTLFEAKYLGITIAFLNCINMLGGSFFHTSIGKLMEYFWNGSYDAEGLKIYSDYAFTNGLLIIPIASIVGAILVFMVGIKRVNSSA